MRQGNTVCARSFQSAVGCIDAARAAPLWSRPTGGIEAVGGDAEVVVGADATDLITAWRTRTGEVLWTSERYRYRSLSGFAVAGSTVVFGDLEGQVHFLARDSGEPQLRLPTDGSAVVGAPVVVDNTILVVTRNGGLFAFRPV
jgi:outer membrane protein assembly factor BamB